MKNLSGTPDYVTSRELSRKKKITKEEISSETPTAPTVLNKDDVEDFIAKFNDMHAQCEKLYETRPLKQLHDMLASFYSMKNDIRKLTEIINN